MISLFVCREWAYFHLFRIGNSSIFTSTAGLQDTSAISSNHWRGMIIDMFSMEDQLMLLTSRWCFSLPLLIGCRNGGTCQEKEVGSDDYTCSCRDGFNGSRCEVDDRGWQPSPPHNDGKLRGIRWSQFSLSMHISLRMRSGWCAQSRSKNSSWNIWAAMINRAWTLASTCVVHLSELNTNLAHLSIICEVHASCCLIVRRGRCDDYPRG